MYRKSSPEKQRRDTKRHTKKKPATNVKDAECTPLGGEREKERERERDIERDLSNLSKMGRHMGFIRLCCAWSAFDAGCA